ncbi:alpha/beta hydrolase [Winogradskyella eckloniae]|uniref:alpha/beta hydrolase n=1 Tax=Winogradskyella eckloniae TaxID=1089306 RepID=UPI0015656CFA|nr:alpha/beta hydrolase [Winogradskyella eckloniae]NRD19295.1 alpha/beta hydrolase [Winogradskyella eckloniae]
MKHLFAVFLFFSFAIGFAQNIKTYTYAIKGIDTLKMDVYTPENIKETDSLPVVVWMHGGGFSGGSRAGTDEKNMANFAASKNYIGVSISYRLLRRGTKTGFGCKCSKEDKLFTFNQGVLDFLDATQFIYENSKTLQVDTSKIVAAGSSAGAEIILHTVFMKRFFLSNDTAYDSINYAAAISFSGAILNSEDITTSNAIPTVLFHGTDDTTVPFGTAPHHNCLPNKAGYMMLDGPNTIVKKLEDLETPYYFNIVKGGAHEVASVNINDLDDVFYFLDKTVRKNDVIQITEYSLPQLTKY